MIDKEIELKKELAEARVLLVEALIAAGLVGSHAADCKGANFARHNRMCPPSHPVWAVAPPCTCWVGRAASFLAK